MTQNAQNLVMLGQFTAPHGVRGLIKLRSFTDDPAAILNYGPLSDRGGREYQVSFKGMAKGALLVSVDGVNDRDAAEKLRGTELHVPRSQLPDDDVDGDEFYQTDLIGLRVVGAGEKVFGTIHAVQNFGAGDMLEVRLPQGRKIVLIPFTRESVPEIDVAAGMVRINGVESLFSDDKDEQNGKDEGEDASE